MADWEVCSLEMAEGAQAAKLRSKAKGVKWCAGVVIQAVVFIPATRVQNPRSLVDWERYFRVGGGPEPNKGVVGGRGCVMANHDSNFEL